MKQCALLFPSPRQFLTHLGPFKPCLDVHRRGAQEGRIHVTCTWVGASHLFLHIGSGSDHQTHPPWPLPFPYLSHNLSSTHMPLLGLGTFNCPRRWQFMPTLSHVWPSSTFPWQSLAVNWIWALWPQQSGSPSHVCPLASSTYPSRSPPSLLCW